VPAAGSGPLFSSGAPLVGAAREARVLGQQIEEKNRQLMESL